MGSRFLSLQAEVRDRAPCASGGGCPHPLPPSHLLQKEGSLSSLNSPGWMNTGHSALDTRDGQQLASHVESHSGEARHTGPPWGTWGQSEAAGALEAGFAVMRGRGHSHGRGRLALNRLTYVAGWQGGEGRDAEHHEMRLVC